MIVGDVEGCMMAGRQALELAATLGDPACTCTLPITWGRHTLASATTAERPRCCGERGGAGPWHAR